MLALATAVQHYLREILGFSVPNVKPWARASEVLTLVLREALLLVLVGVAVGVPVVFAATRFASTLLFGLTPTDPLSLSVAALLLVVVALAAAYIPARRAAKVDPLVALRYE